MDPSDDRRPSSEARIDGTAAPGTLLHPSARRAQNSLTLTIPQAATLLGISVSAAYEFARKGELPTFKLGTCGWPWQSSQEWPRWSPILANHDVAIGGQRRSPPFRLS
jgi:predicted DNA-binding transcriptional regulator AlpA